MLETLEIEQGENVRRSVIWMHGLGADGHDFEPIVPHLGLPEGIGLRFVFPHAPRRAVTINNGFVMRAWYDIREMSLDRQQDAQGIRDSDRLIGELIGREGERGIPPDRIVLAGFSQGGVMALHSGLRFPARLAGILALSCYLPLAESVSSERHAANKGIPVFLAHGRYDEVIPMVLGHAAYQQLVALGYSASWREYSIAHEVNFDEIKAVGGWLDAVFNDRADQNQESST